MDDLKVRQAMGAMEGQMRVLVDEGEAQGRVAGAAAEAERIWGLGKVLAGEWDTPSGALRNSFSGFLAELRGRAVPGEAAESMPADELVQASQAYAPYRADPLDMRAKLAANESRLEEPAPVYDGSQDEPGAVAPDNGTA